ncbi:hypothetical protein, partial [Paenibacillus odorifer]|uniref:hypothetical protein n=1 Tax=Paenibacillus odorifer TaxID=189426 RepID=UPI001C4AADFE
KGDKFVNNAIWVRKPQLGLVNTLLEWAANPANHYAHAAVTYLANQCVYAAVKPQRTFTRTQQ